MIDLAKRLLRWPRHDSVVARGLCTVADAAQEAMLVCSADNKVIHSNEAAADLFGCPGGELVGRDVDDPSPISSPS